MRKVAMRLDKAFAAGAIVRIDGNQISEILLSIAEELDPPLPGHDQSTTNTEC